MESFADFLEAAQTVGGVVGTIGGALGGAGDFAGDVLFGEDGNDIVDLGMDVDGGWGMPEVLPAGTVGGLGALDLANAMASPEAQNAAMSVVRAVMGSGVVGALVRTMLDQLPGVIFDAREPSYQGSPLTVGMLSMLFRKLSKSEQEAIVERLAGGMSPLSDTNATRKNFRFLYVYDALRALNEQDAAEAIFYGQR